jgi:NAD(P)-dependent dehydrogenase (short-subunit alcohol dehydrogenase family)
LIWFEEHFGFAQKEQHMELKDQVIIVTGGASGIGKESAYALARKGAHLLIADYNEEGAKAVAAEVEALGVKALP